MAQDLIGLTVHIAPKIGFAFAIEQARTILWEDRQISEQFEALLLNTSHSVIAEALAKSTDLSGGFELQAEIAAQFDEENLEEWFSVGVNVHCHNQDYDEITQITTNDQVAQSLCQVLQKNISTLLAKTNRPDDLIIEVEVTSYGGMWS